MILALAAPASSAGEDPNIANWLAEIADPGPEPTPEISLLDGYGAGSPRPRSSLIGKAQVRYKDGTTVGCVHASESVQLLPDTPYTLWLVRKTGLESRNDPRHDHPWFADASLPDELRYGPQRVVREARCGQTNESGDFRFDDVPTGRYLLVAKVSRYGIGGGAQQHFDYVPGGPGNGWYGTTSGGTHLVSTESFQIFSSVKVKQGGIIYVVPPFFVFSHHRVPR